MSVTIEWKKVDTAAKANSSLSMQNKQSFSNLDLLKNNNINSQNLATVGELNQTNLDDEQTIFPDNTDNVQFGLWGNVISNDDCGFTESQILVITFSDTVSSTGITLRFWEPSNDFCSDVTIRWYDIDDVLIDTKQFVINNTLFFCENSIEDFSKLEIQFDKTSVPNRFIKMQAIYYGEFIRLNSETIISANSIEELSLNSQKLVTNEFDCSLINLDDNYNFVTNPGIFNLIAVNQKMKVFLNEDEYGNYYIKESEIQDNIVNLKCFDLIGYLDKRDFKGDLYDTTFGEIINEIVEQAELLEVFEQVHNGFDVPNEILALPIKGFISYTTCREALHNICYAASVIANCYKEEKIKITEIDSTLKETIGQTKTILGSYSIEYNQKYSGISLNAFEFVSNETEEILTSSTYSEGTHIIKFSEPKHDFRITGGTITNSSASFVEFSVVGTVEVEVFGKGYTKTITQFEANNQNYKSSIKSIKQMTDIMIVHPDYAQDVCDNQLNDYINEYKVDLEVIFVDSGLGDNINIKEINGTITKVEQDLLQEDIKELEVVGNARNDI